VADVWSEPTRGQPTVLQTAIDNALTSTNKPGAAHLGTYSARQPVRGVKLSAALASRHSRYDVLGLAMPMRWSDGFFHSR
jgi:hypothetical protein